MAPQKEKVTIKALWLRWFTTKWGHHIRVTIIAHIFLNSFAPCLHSKKKNRKKAGEQMHQPFSLAASGNSWKQCPFLKEPHDPSQHSQRTSRNSLGWNHKHTHREKGSDKNRARTSNWEQGKKEKKKRSKEGEPTVTSPASSKASETSVAALRRKGKLSQA